MKRFADMAELADAPDLGSGVYDVQVQVLLSALKNGRMRWNSVFPAVFLCPLILKWYCFNNYLMNRDGLICPQLRFALMGTRQSTGAGVAKHTLWPSRLAICRGSRWYWNDTKNLYRVQKHDILCKIASVKTAKNGIYKLPTNHIAAPKVCTELPAAGESIWS